MKRNISIMCMMVCIAASAVAQQSKRVPSTSPPSGTKPQTTLTQAKKDSIAEYRKFRTEAFEQIEENNKRIQALKDAKVAKEKAYSERYLERVKLLEAQNRELRESVVNYSAEKNTNWAAFKRDFMRKMESLRQSFIDSRD